MKIRKAVFPAAGLGTRFLPATKSQPKEMLPIVDKPVIQYLVEEAVAAGIEEIVIVTGRGKRSIEDHFDHSFELEHTLEAKGKTDALKEVQAIPNMARFVYVRQPFPLGDGHAILCAKEVIGNEPFAVLFGDDVIDGPKPALQQLIEAYEAKQSSIIGLEKIDKADSASYGILEPSNSEGRIHEVKSLVEKPEPQNAPSDLAIIGKYICTPEIFSALEASVSSHKDGEIRLIDGFIKLMEQQKIFGYELEGKRYDTGKKIELIKATLDFALQREDLGPELKQYIKELDL